MKAYCGTNCEECELFNNKCRGCLNTKGCPFGKKCWIAKYIEVGGKENFDLFKKQLIEEFKSLNIDGISSLDDLYPLHGDFVNLEYTLPNGKKVKFLNDDELFLGNQIELKGINKCLGLVANMSFLLVCEYEENGVNPEIIIYKRR